MTNERWTEVKFSDESIIETEHHTTTISVSSDGEIGTGDAVREPEAPLDPVERDAVMKRFTVYSLD